jgi:hypothetical protein
MGSASATSDELKNSGERLRGTPINGELKPFLIWGMSLVLTPACLMHHRSERWSDLLTIEERFEVGVFSA